MKRMNKAAFIAALVCLAMIVTSCNGLFTTTTMPGAARDPGQAASALANQPTADLVANTRDVDSMEGAQTLVAALSQKAKDDPDFASNLSSQEKQDIISAATIAVIDMASIAQNLDIASLMGGNGDGDGDGTGDGTGDDAMGQVLDAIVGSIGSTDTTCVVAILNNSLNESGELTQDVLDSPEMQSSLAMGAIAVAASTVSSTGASGADLIATFESAGSSNAEDILPDDASDEEIASLQASIDTLMALTEAGFDITSLFGGAGGDDGSSDPDNGNGN